MSIHSFFSDVFSLSTSFLTASDATHLTMPWRDWIYYMVIHSSLSGASPNCGSAVLLLFFLLLFFWYHFFQIGKYMCVASLSLITFICLLVTAISHCQNIKQLTIDKECLFSYDSYSSNSCLSCFTSASRVSSCLSAIVLAAGALPSLASSQRVGLTHCVKSFCPWGSQQRAMETWLSPVSTLALTDGYLSALRLWWPKAPVRWCWVRCAAAQTKGGAVDPITLQGS